MSKIGMPTITKKDTRRVRRHMLSSDDGTRPELLAKTIRLPKSVWEKLDRVAAGKQLSLSSLLRSKVEQLAI